MVKLVVLEANIASMTEFKQIIGRGTRIREAEGKVYFTIMDFRKATNLFADPDFDGNPVQIYEPGVDEPVVPPEDGHEDDTDRVDILLDPPMGGGEIYLPPEGPEEPVRKYYVNNVTVSVAHERVQYYGADGKLITESLKDYTRKNIQNEYASLDEFILKWNTSEKKEELMAELADHGVLLEALKEEIGQELDPFDLICHVAFDQPALTRKERADEVRKRNYFTKYGGVAQKVLNSLLDKYENEGITSIESGSILKVKPLNEFGSPVEIVRAFGKNKDFEAALRELEKEIYNIA
jgi:type I restriction enzyme, R subunit